MGLTVYGGGGKPEEEKTVTAGTSVIEVSPSSGKVMKKVTVNPTPTESKSVTPTTSELTVTPSDGKHLSKVVVGAVEDVTPEVTAQTPVITQILEGLVGKAQGANATADKILEGYSAYVGQNLINGTLTKSGVYVWKKLTAQGGDFIDFVVSDQETAYPDGGEQDGYWYEKVVEGIDLKKLFGYTKIVIDKFTLTSDTAANSKDIYHSLGETPKRILVVSECTSPSHIADVDVIYNGDEYSMGLFVGYYWTGNTTKASVRSGSSTSFRANANYLFSISSTDWKAGVQYTLITMA